MCRQCIHRMHESSMYNSFVSSTGPFYNMTPEERIDADNRSVYVGNVRLVYLSFLHIEHVFVFFSHLWSDTLLNKSQVDYGATADELEIHFNGCGPVNRVTILCDRFSGHPKGWVYTFDTVWPKHFYHKHAGIQVYLLAFSLFFYQLCLHRVLWSRLCA